MQDIIWTDSNTGQKFIVNEDGERIFIMDDGSKVCESDLILEQMLADLEEQDLREREELEEEEDNIAREEAEYLAMVAEEEMRRDEEECMIFYEQMLGTHFDIL